MRRVSEAVSIACAKILRWEQKKGQRSWSRIRDGVSSVGCMTESLLRKYLLIPRGSHLGGSPKSQGPLEGIQGIHELRCISV